MGMGMFIAESIRIHECTFADVDCVPYLFLIQCRQLQQPFEETMKVFIVLKDEYISMGLLE